MKTIAFLSLIFLSILASFAKKGGKEDVVWHTDLNKAIDIANKEFAWCDRELLKASRESAPCTHTCGMRR